MPRLPNQRSSCVWLVLLAFLVAGCTGTPASLSSWQDATDKAIGGVRSGLGTARIVLRAEEKGDLPHTYAVVALTDAIDAGSKELSGYLVGQPPDAQHLLHARVVGALHEAVALLVDVRVEVASPGLDRAAAQRLLDRLSTLMSRLDDLDTTVTRSPTAGASR